MLRRHQAASSRSADLDVDRGELPLSSHSVEKLQDSDIAIFRQIPIIPISLMGSIMRGEELAHERRNANLAEPLATKS
jgi:hypothetical protein